MLRRSKIKNNKGLIMKTEINLSPSSEMVIENVMRPAMNPVEARSAAQEDAHDALVRLNILPRRRKRISRRTARAIA